MKSVLTILVLAMTSYAFAHGGGGGGGHTEEKKVEVRQEVRHAPHHPEEIDQSELDNFLGAKEMFPDVVTVHCKLGEFANCRGIEIGLYDQKGKLIAKGHSGTTGIVGFQGLKSGGRFVAKIESEKYRGEAFVHGGASFGIEAVRK